MALIGISGKIGVGKDTVGKIIQYLVTKKYYPQLIIDDFKEFYEEYKNSDKPLIYYDNGGSIYSKFEIKKFAGKLKQIASLLTGIPVEDFEDQDFKKTSLGTDWDYKLDIFEGKEPFIKYVKTDLEPMVVRKFLQKLGTEAMRDGLHENVWVNALFADYRRPKMSEYNPSNWIVTDVRFPNELEAINDANGLTIRVVRQYSKEDLCKGSSPFIRDEELSAKLAKRYKSMEDLPVVPPPHESEIALDDAEFDYTIINDGSMEDLIEKVRQILITEKII